MAWDFETDPEFQKKLDWIEEFMEDEVEPLSHLGMAAVVVRGPREVHQAAAGQKVKDAGPVGLPPRPRAGRPGLRPAQARSDEREAGPHRPRAPRVRLPGARHRQRRDHRPLRHRPSRRRQWLKPLLNGEIRSAFSMSEPTGGSDPLTFKTRAELDGDEWVINGEKWFSSPARATAEVLVVYAVTDPDHKDPYQRTSIFLVPTKTPRASRSCAASASAQARRRAATAISATPTSRCPKDALLGDARRRVHGRPDPPGRRPGAPRHAHRRRLPASAFDLMCQRAVSRQTRDGRLADLQMVQEQIADSWIAARAVPPAGAAHRLADRQAQGLQAGAQGHRRDQGGDAQGLSRHRRHRRCTCTARIGRLQRDAVHGHGDARL